MDKAMSSMEQLVDKEQRTMSRPGNSLVVEDVVSSGKASANHLQSCSLGVFHGTLGILKVVHGRISFW